MRIGLWFVVAQALMLSSCSPETGEVVFQPPTVTRASIPVQAETPSSYALPPREAMVLEIENQVLAYTFSSQDPIPAVNGMRIQPSGGVASVRGSLLSVEYDSERNRLEAACLEGECTLEEVHGIELELPEGEYSVIEGDKPPTEPEPMLREDIEDWLEMNPDLGEFLEEVPDPEDFPQSNESEGNETIEEIIEELPMEPPSLP